MDAIVFRMKRAHLCVQHGFLAKLLKPCVLTPARFDLMYVLMTSGRAMTQAELHRELGVSRPTISRMVASLARLKLVDRRQYRRGTYRHLSLTTLGQVAFRHARRKTMARNIVRRTIDRTISFGPNKFAFREDLESALRALGKRFGDRAGLFYPWHPDD